jgi:hypothetical protein
MTRMILKYAFTFVDVPEERTPAIISHLSPPVGIQGRELLVEELSKIPSGLTASTRDYTDIDVLMVAWREGQTERERHASLINDFRRMVRIIHRWAAERDVTLHVSEARPS